MCRARPILCSIASWRPQPTTIRSASRIHRCKCSLFSRSIQDQGGRSSGSVWTIGIRFVATMREKPPQRLAKLTHILMVRSSSVSSSSASEGFSMMKLTVFKGAINSSLQSRVNQNRRLRLGCENLAAPGFISTDSVQPRRPNNNPQPPDPPADPFR